MRPRRVDDDVIVAPRERHLPRDRVGARIEPERTPVSVGAQRLVAVPGVDVDEVVRPLNDLAGDGVGDPLGYGAVAFAGIDTVQVLAVDRAVVDGPPQERRQVRHVHEQHRAGEARRIELAPHTLQCDDGRDFVAVRPGDERERRARILAAHDRERHARAGVDAGRDIDEARALLSGARGGGSDAERCRLLR